jgi:L-asparaginase
VRREHPCVTTTGGLFVPASTFLARAWAPRARGVLVPAASAGLAAALVATLTGSPGSAPAAPAFTVSGVSTEAPVDSVAYRQAALIDGKPKVTVIGTGGTLAGVARSRSSFTNYSAGRIPIADLVQDLQPEIDAVADVETVQFGNAGSGGYTIAQFHALTAAVEEALETSDGVVVTSGTDTMEEFAYWLDLTVQSRKPVVMTGAMRPTRAGSVTGAPVIGADGPANLYNSIVLAASQATYCYGTVLMLNDEFHAARDVTKTNATRMDTFQTRQLGVLGWIDGPDIKVGRAPARVQHCDDLGEWLTPFDVSEITPAELPRVEIFYNYQQAGGEAITAFAQAGVKGIVTAGTGAGGISGPAGAARSAAVRNQGVVFVSTTRTGSGSVSGGSGNVIPGDDLLPQKARLLLLLSLAFAPDDVEQVREWVTTIGNPEWDTYGSYATSASFDDLAASVTGYRESGALSESAAASLADRLTRAKDAFAAGSEAGAIGFLQQFVERANSQVKGDADDTAVREALVAAATGLIDELRAMDADELVVTG